MANISNETINTLWNIDKINVCFYDNNMNEVDKEQATKIHLFSFNDNGYFSKTLQATKKETTYSYIQEKINQANTYVNFCNDFKKLINTNCFDVYPTTYGIGVFVAISFRNEKEDHKRTIEEALNKYNVDYTTEYSEAGWVFRYKISKSKDNISKLSAIK